MKKPVRMADIGALLSSPLAKNDLGPMILPQNWNRGEHSLPPPLSPTEILSPHFTDEELGS